MTLAYSTPATRMAVIALAAALMLSAGCAATPKTAPPVTSASTPVASEAASTSMPAPLAAPAGAPQTLPPIARSQEFSDRAELGLTPQASAATAGQANVQVAATLGEAGDRIFFLTDRFDLTDEARTILARQAAWISANPSKRVIIAGSADERGTREYNLALGSRRASAARDYLISLGVNSASIETLSYGKERPLDARSNPDGWAINRNSLTQLLD